MSNYATHQAVIIPDAHPGVREDPFLESVPKRLIAFDPGSGFYTYEDARLIPTTPRPGDTLNLVPEHPATLRKLETALIACGCWRSTFVVRGLLLTALPVDAEKRQWFTPQFLAFFDRNREAMVALMARPDVDEMLQKAYV